MQNRRPWLVGGLLLAGLQLFTLPVAAQSVNRNLIDQLNLQFLYVALPLSIFVELILIYAVVRFRNNDDPKPTAEDAPLEITWTIATAIILLFVGVSAYTVFANPYISPAQSVDVGASAGDAVGADPPADAVVVDVVAYQWGWQFRYPGANVTTQNALVLPTDRDVYLRLSSADVVHSLFVPKLGLKQDIFPARRTVARTRVTQRGEYRVYCAEFCGAGHSRMLATATAVSPDAYRRWLDAHRGEGNVTSAPTPGANASVSASA